MSSERYIDYEALTQVAMRGLVRSVLARVAQSGLPGEHHFYIAFRTDAQGVVLSPRLKEKYPEEMTIVLQHRFWDLKVSDECFEVKLTFDGIPERLRIPFAAIKVFFDPSVPYGLQFEDSEGAGETTREIGSKEAERKTVPTLPGVARGIPAVGGKSEVRPGPAVVAERADKKRPQRRSRPEKSDELAAAPRVLKPGPVPIENAGSARDGEKPDRPPDQANVVRLDQFRKK
jgi:hypothetical protein